MKILMKTDRKETVKRNNPDKDKGYICYPSTREKKYSVSALIAVCVLYLFTYSVCAKQSSLIVRNWSLSGERTESFEMTDSCIFTVTFTDLIPPTYLLGYDRFDVTISDSLNPAGLTAVPVLHISFDAGFLYFNHILTVTIPFSSPLIPDSLQQSGVYKLYRDPFPYTGFHQWYADDSLTIDSSRSLIRFVYHHPKYVPLQKSKNYAKIKIASTGYPFDFGLFWHPSIEVYRQRNTSTQDMGFICYPNKKGIMVYRSDSKDKYQNMPYRVVLFNGQGRKIGQWDLSVFPALLPISYHASTGMYLAVFYRENCLAATFSGIFQGNEIAP